jgi:WD40 repeat protein
MQAIQGVRPARWILLAVAVLLCGGGLQTAAGPKTGGKNSGEVRQFPFENRFQLVAFSPDGKTILTDDVLWEAATGRKVLAFGIPKIRGGVLAQLAFSPDGRYVASHYVGASLVSPEYEIVVWKTATGKEVWRTKREHIAGYGVGNGVLAFMPDGKQLVTARGDEGLIRVWDVATGKEVRSFSFEQNHKPPGDTDLSRFAISADGKLVLVDRFRSGPVLLELATGTQRKLGSLDRSLAPRFAASPDCQHLIHGIYAKDLKADQMVLKDLHTGKAIRRYDLHRYEVGGGYVTSVTFSRDGQRLAAGIQGNRPKDRLTNGVQCWDVKTGKTLRVFEGHQDLVECVAISPDGRFVLSGSEDQTARLWRLKE